ncbi:hypothetical protein JW859_05760 [bacterium]|nr:hypothetical protein [bacterium]
MGTGAQIPGQSLHSQIPEQWQVPALLRLRQRIQSERVTHGLLMAIAAIASIPVGMVSGALLGALFPLMSDQLGDVLGAGSWLEQLLAPLGLGLSVAGNLLMFGGALVLPALIIIGAIVAYSNQRRFALRDLLWGRAALVLVDESYMQQIEEAIRSRFRPRFVPVDPGATFVDRVHYFAHFYLYFRQLAHGQRDLRVPLTAGRNCWFDGILTCLGGLLSPCVGLGIPLVVPMIFRIAVSWSRQLAIKQAVFEYFIGMHEQELVDAADQQRVQPHSSSGDVG